MTAKRPRPARCGLLCGSEMRLSVAGNGAGVPKDQGGLLRMWPSSANLGFQVGGDVGQYYPRAKIAIPKTDGSLWERDDRDSRHADSAAGIERRELNRRFTRMVFRNATLGQKNLGQKDGAGK